MRVCKRVHYRGTVQGVGFRYTTWNIAQGYVVAGYVKNLPSGAVEVVAEGDAGEVERFLRGVAEQMAGYIQDQTVDDIPTAGLESFEIRH